jgi:microcin C transport system substrate-binding protein
MRARILVLTMIASAALVAGESPAPIVWETNLDEPLIGDPAAPKGGTFNYFIQAYPLTFRLLGPNSNDAFAAWNRAYSMNFTLVMRHPTTDKYIPWMATHWSIAPDRKTVYFKLDPDARFSDSAPITADDYVYCYQLMRAKEIVDPYYNNYAETYYASVEAIDRLTLKVVGVQESWRPLDDFAVLWPVPRHVEKLTSDWVKEANNRRQVVPGPYVVSEAAPGERVVFTRIKDWWGRDKRYFRGMYNVDRITLKVVPLANLFDYFKKREVGFMTVVSAKAWANEMEFDALKKGWAHRKQEYLENPQGIFGLHMNLATPFFASKDVRKAIQHLFPFELMNSRLMYNSYVRQVSVFEGTEYANRALKPYEFSPKKAQEYLEKAGFATRGADGILANAKGERASFTLTYGNKLMEPHLTIIQQIFQKGGVTVQLNLLEPATAFNRGAERKYEMLLAGRTTTFYPSPYQYYHSDFAKKTNNNNLWGFGREDTDKLVDVYRFELDRGRRIAAMHELDAIVQDEAFYIPFWTGPYIRFLYWDDLCFPRTYFPKRTQQMLDWQIFWVDPARTAHLEEAMRAGASLGEDPEIEVDPWNLKPGLVR